MLGNKPLSKPYTCQKSKLALSVFASKTVPLFHFISFLQFAMMEAVIVGITDKFPVVGKHRIKFVGVCSFVGFLLGLPLTTKVRESHKMYMVAVGNIGMFYYVNLNESSSMHIHIQMYNSTRSAF